MAITCNCPKCSRGYVLKDEYAGKTVKCACGVKFTVSAAGAAPRPVVKPGLPPKLPPLKDEKTLCACPKCGHSFRVKKDLLGKKATCPACRVPFTLGASDDGKAGTEQKSSENLGLARLQKKCAGCGIDIAHDRDYCAECVNVRVARAREELGRQKDGMSMDGLKEARDSKMEDLKRKGNFFVRAWVAVVYPFSSLSAIFMYLTLQCLAFLIPFGLTFILVAADAAYKSGESRYSDGDRIAIAVVALFLCFAVISYGFTYCLSVIRESVLDQDRAPSVPTWGEIVENIVPSLCFFMLYFVVPLAATFAGVADAIFAGGEFQTSGLVKFGGFLFLASILTMPAAMISFADRSAIRDLLYDRPVMMMLKMAIPYLYLLLMLVLILAIWVAIVTLSLTHLIPEPDKIDWFTGALWNVLFTVIQCYFIVWMARVTGLCAAYHRKEAGIFKWVIKKNV